MAILTKRKVFRGKHWSAEPSGKDRTLTIVWGKWSDVPHREVFKNIKKAGAAYKIIAKRNRKNIRSVLYEGVQVFI